MSKRILVVEDQEDNRKILRDLLDSAGYQMTEAWDGEAGVSAAKEQAVGVARRRDQTHDSDLSTDQQRKGLCPSRRAGIS